MTHELHTQHERRFEASKFVYPVLSRRSDGISIGVNLNPDKICNFDCIYCQVDRTRQSETRFVEIDLLLDELGWMLELVLSGQLYETEKFRGVPLALRRLNDIAFSGDGEPTTYRNFDEIIERCAKLKTRHEARHEVAESDRVKMVLITNASMFHRPHVQRGLAVLDRHHGEIWAKLDAGTQEYYQQVERTVIPLERILENITSAAIARPVVIQALFMRIADVPPSPDEQEAFCDRLNEIVTAGGAIQLVQIYTVARPPAESFVTPLADQEVDALAELVRKTTSLPTATFYGAT